MKPKTYNYYIDQTEFENDSKFNIVNILLKQNECIICLDQLIRPEQPITENIEHNQDPYSFNYNPINPATRLELMSLYDKLTLKIKAFIESLKYVYTKKKFMKTPCDHIFHTECLEKWMEMKHECPFCRRNIPSLEY